MSIITINPNDIIDYLDSKDKRIILETESGAKYWDGKYALSAKDIFDFIMDNLPSSVPTGLKCPSCGSDKISTRYADKECYECHTKF